MAKRLDSQMSVNLERRQIGEQFRILDPARLPEKPYSPNRATSLPALDRRWRLPWALALPLAPNTWITAFVRKTTCAWRWRCRCWRRFR